MLLYTTRNTAPTWGVHFQKTLCFKNYHLKSHVHFKLIDNGSKHSLGKCEQVHTKTQTKITQNTRILTD
jgi:hypothetical protein